MAQANIMTEMVTWKIKIKLGEDPEAQYQLGMSSYNNGILFKIIYAQKILDSYQENYYSHLSTDGQFLIH